VARLHGDGTGGAPLLLLSHLDVVPAPPESWTHDPFGGDLADGYVWGRGAVDMKSMIAMELAVVRLLADRARAAGRDPGSDPVPGLRRDVLVASTADEEAGGLHGIAWLVDERPETLRAAGTLNEAGGVAMTIAGRRFYPIQVAEKGYAVYRITVHGTWGHGSMPRADNAAVRAAEVVRRLGVPGPIRVTPPVRRFFEALATGLPDAGATVLRLVLAGDAAAEAGLDDVCEPGYARAARALVRDTVSPNVIHAGVKYTVIPGEAYVELDCRTLAGTTEADLTARLEAAIGDDLLASCDVEPIVQAPAVEAPVDSALYRLLEATVRDHDPDGIPVPAVAPFATDAKHLVRLGVPAYGFSPLRAAPDEPYLERYHAVDERVGVEALRWGLPVLHDVVARFCG
jgi:acetylornithine deacetylase/succinyl-diaminopimelate desuccinylase-like protein